EGGILDPPSIARATQVENQPAVDLVHRFLLCHALQLSQDSLDLPPNVGFRVFCREGRINDRLDGDSIEVPRTRLERHPTAGTRQTFGCYFLVLHHLTCLPRKFTTPDLGCHPARPTYLASPRMPRSATQKGVHCRRSGGASSGRFFDPG